MTRRKPAASGTPDEERAKTRAPGGLPDGPWAGWWEYRAEGAIRKKMSLELRWSGGALEGWGKDEDGAFRIRGRLDPATNEVRFEKRYAGPWNSGTARYRGALAAKTIAGQVYDAPEDEEPSAAFEIKPARKPGEAAALAAQPHAALAEALREALPHLAALQELAKKHRKALQRLSDVLYDLEYHDDTRLDIDEALGSLSPNARDRVAELIEHLEVLA